MFPEARIDVTLTVEGGSGEAGSIARVRIGSGRLTGAAALLAGRHPAEVTRLLPTVFSLCGTAQGLAGLMAVEQALGITPKPGHHAARRLLLLAETVGEHALGMARDWPLLAGGKPDLARAKELRATLARLRLGLYPDGDWTRPGGGKLHPDRATLAAAAADATTAFTHLLGADPAEILDSLATLTAWAQAGRSAPAALLGKVLADGAAAFGRCRFLPMPADGPPDLTERLSGDLDGHYVARPDCGGAVYETGPLSRMAQHHPIPEILSTFGNGLLARFAARLIETKEGLQDIATLVHDLFDASGTRRPHDAAGTGLGLVEAARGLLVHRVEMAEGRVTRYQILAPTEWNFHPAGPLAAGLTGIPAENAQARAALLVNALDPCVACVVTVE